MIEMDIFLLLRQFRTSLNCMTAANRSHATATGSMEKFDIVANVGVLGNAPPNSEEALEKSHSMARIFCVMQTVMSPVNRFLTWARMELGKQVQTSVFLKNFGKRVGNCEYTLQPS